MAKASTYQSSMGLLGAFSAFLGIIFLVYTQLTPPISDISLLSQPSPLQNRSAIRVEGQVLPVGDSVSGLTCSEVEVAVVPEGAAGDDRVGSVRATGHDPSAGCAFSLSGAEKYAGKNLVLSGRALGPGGKTYGIQGKVLNIPGGSTLKVNLYLAAAR
jgi:hypothetical protein